MHPIFRLLCLLTLLTLCNQAFSQVVTTTTLGAAGGTDLQRRTGDAVQMVCGGFVNQGVDDTRADVASQSDLFDKCGEMVHTANRLAGNNGPTVKDLGINQQQLQAALQNIAGEEIAAAGTIATEASASQSSNISSRLSSIMSRASSLQVSSVNVYGNNALYALNQDTVFNQSGGSAGDEDGLDPNRWGLFVNGVFGATNKDATDSEDGFDASAQGFTVGADYRISSNAALGVALGYANSTTDFDVTANVSGGGLDVVSSNLSAYALWFGERFFADGILTFGTGNYDLEREIFIPSTGDLIDANGDANDGASRIAVADTDSSQLRASFSAGAEFTQGSMTFAPYARVSLLQVALDGYEESGAGGLNLNVQNQDIQSVTTAIGYRLVGVMSTGFSIISPQINFEWVHEFSDDSRDIVSTYIHDPRELELVAVTDHPDRNYFTAGVGVTSVFRNRAQLYADVKTLLDLDGVSEFVVTLGARFAL